MNSLRPALGRWELSELRQWAASRTGRTRMQNLLTEYRARRGAMSHRDQAMHDIAAARVRYALDEAQADAAETQPVIQMGGDAA